MCTVCFHAVPLEERTGRGRAACPVLKTKKTPVVVKDGPGFLVNRILMPYLNEAGYLLAEGVSIKDLDDACLNFGMPMGPCRLLDEIGIDVGSKVAKILLRRPFKRGIEYMPWFWNPIMFLIRLLPYKLVSKL